MFKFRRLWKTSVDKIRSCELVEPASRLYKLPEKQILKSLFACEGAAVTESSLPLLKEILSLGAILINSSSMHALESKFLDRFAN